MKMKRRASDYNPHKICGAPIPSKKGTPQRFCASHVLAGADVCGRHHPDYATHLAEGKRKGKAAPVPAPVATLGTAFVPMTRLTCANTLPVNGGRPFLVLQWGTANNLTRITYRFSSVDEKQAFLWGVEECLGQTGAEVVKEG